MGSYSLMGTKFHFGMMNILWMDGSDGWTTIWMYLMPLSCTLRNS